MLALISATKVSRISPGSVVHSFITCRGAIAAITVTADTEGSPVRSAASDGQAECSSSSAMQ
jgi:hypothetical protein